MLCQQIATRPIRIGQFFKLPPGDFSTKGRPASHQKLVATLRIGYSGYAQKKESIHAFSLKTERKSKWLRFTQNTAPESFTCTRSQVSSREFRPHI